MKAVRPRPLLVGVCLVALCAAPAAADQVLDAPPPNITPVSLPLRAVMCKQNCGQAAAQSRAARERRWAIAAYKLTGSADDVELGANSRVSVTLGPLTELHGNQGAAAWRQNSNGLTIRLKGIHQRDALSDGAIETAERTGAAPGVTLLGEVTRPLDAYVVQVAPPGGRREWLFYAKADGLLARTEAVVVDRRVVTTFDDFRTVAGVPEAWHFRVDDGRPGNVEDWRLQSDVTIASPPASLFEPPPDARPLVVFPAGVSSVRLPARVVAARIVVRVEIGGQDLDMLLDSGASGIVLDPSVVSQLGLATFGRSTRETAGQYEQTSAIVPEMRIGSLRMRNVAVSVLPFRVNPSSDTKLVGILGFDFLDSVALRIDYGSGAVDASPPGGAALPADAARLPIALDDFVPVVSAQAGGAEGDHFIFDTGATSAVLFSGFASAHPQAVRDEGLGFRIEINNPFQFAGGVGGRLRVQPTQLTSYGAGGQDFHDFLAFVIRHSPGYEGEDEDGLIGYAYLRYFTVYMDYHDQLVALARNGLAYAPSEPSATETVLP